MALTVEELVALQDEQTPIVSRLDPIPPEPVLAQAFALLDSENFKVPVGRQVLRSTIQEVVAEELAEHDDEDEDVQTFSVLRAVANFIRVAQEGPGHIGESTPYTDLLPVGNPISTARRFGITASAYREAVADWESAHPDLDDDLRPLVSSAFRTEPGTVEHIHATARLHVAKPGLIPSDVLADL